MTLSFPVEKHVGALFDQRQRDFLALGDVRERAYDRGEHLDVRARALGAALKSFVVFQNDRNGDAADAANGAGFGHDAGKRTGDVADVAPAIIE